MPYSPNWSAAPDFLDLIATYCLSKKPAVIVECSSGTSTLVLARCCQLNGHGHVYSLENGATYAAATTKHLEQAGLQAQASVIHTPLVEHKLNGKIFNWYNLEKLDVSAIDMLVIDGPPAVVDGEARYPALPLLHDRLTLPCSVFLDDANRVGERAIVKRWIEQYPHLNVHMLESERGCARIGNT